MRSGTAHVFPFHRVRAESINIKGFFFQKINRSKIILGAELPNCRTELKKTALA